MTPLPHSLTEAEPTTMSFANWKQTSKVYLTWTNRADNYGVDLDRCCQAAYKAGERQGRKDAEEIAMRAIALSNLMEQSK